jgi:hypothetical protein
MIRLSTLVISIERRLRFDILLPHCCHIAVRVVHGYEMGHKEGMVNISQMFN